MDTTNILFICGGAFVGLEKVIAKRTGKKSMGFLQEEEKNGKALNALSVAHKREGRCSAFCFQNDLCLFK